MPFNIDPQVIQKLLFGGPQAAMMPQDPMAAPPVPAPTPDAPPRGSIAASMPQQAPPQEQPQTQAPTAPPARGSIAASMPQFTPPTPISPDSIQNPYQRPQRGKLAKVFLGIGEALGNPLATRIGERDRDLSEKHNEFEATGRQKTAADLNRESAQTAAELAGPQRQQYEMEKDRETAKANAISQIMGDVEGGKFGTGDALLSRWRRIAQANPHLGLTDEDIQGAIAGTHPLGAKYSLIKGENGRPEGLQDREGNQYTPDQITKDLAGDKEAQTLWSAALSGHQQGLSEQEGKEKRVAGYAAARQGEAFSHAEKMKGVTAVDERAGTALDADERLSRMERAYQKGLKGDQQAMLALLTDHIGMTMGLQKGARITKDILNEAQGSMPWLEKIGAKFDDRGLLSGAALGPEQMRQMLDLGYEARDRAYGSVRDAATMHGVPLPKGFDQVERKRVTGAKPAIEQGKPQVKVGQTVSVKGKQVKITAVHPDGSFDAQ